MGIPATIGTGLFQLLYKYPYTEFCLLSHVNSLVLYCLHEQTPCGCMLCCYSKTHTHVYVSGDT